MPITGSAGFCGIHSSLSSSFFLSSSGVASSLLSSSSVASFIKSFSFTLKCLSVLSATIFCITLAQGAPLQVLSFSRMLTSCTPQ